MLLTREKITLRNIFAFYCRNSLPFCFKGIFAELFRWGIGCGNEKNCFKGKSILLMFAYNEISMSLKNCKRLSAVTQKSERSFFFTQQHFKAVQKAYTCFQTFNELNILKIFPSQARAELFYVRRKSLALKLAIMSTWGDVAPAKCATFHSLWTFFLRAS